MRIPINVIAEDRAANCRTMDAKLMRASGARAQLEPGISANPYLSFFTTATESGTFDFEWIGDNGFSQTASAPITVE